MRSSFLLIYFGILALSIHSCDARNPDVLTGIDVLERNSFQDLDGLAIGLITNQTGVNKELRSTIDLLHSAENVDLKVLFGPEHGVRGNYPAGASVRDYKDEMTDLTVYSLYGATRKPAANMLEGLDALVFDIQDIGVRSYTYLSTMRLAMEAAAEHNLKFFVLDRPNPLGGLRIEGFPAPRENDHFIAPWFVPYVHGMTLGEIALMMNEELFLDAEEKLNLTIIPLQHWHRSMIFEETGLPWVPTSPHIPHSETAAYYAATGLLGELDVINIGIGYTLPFQLFGAPWISSEVFAERMNAYRLDGVRFRPASWKPFYGPHQDAVQHGVQIILDKNPELNLFALQFLLIRTHDMLYPQRNILNQTSANRLQMFRLVAGGTWAESFSREMTTINDFDELENLHLQEFLKIRAKYLRY